MDIKVIAGVFSLLVGFGSLFVFQGQLITRVDVLEAQSAPNIKPLEQDVANLKSEIAVLKTKIDSMRAKESNPLLR